MADDRGTPSSWLMRNSMGFPDFLFTILTYAMLLLIFISLVWIGFGLLAFVHAGTPKQEALLSVMESMRAGLISLVGVVFGLAGSYTVRRFKKDDHYIQKKKLEHNGEAPVGGGLEGMIQKGLGLVMNEEDI